MTFNDPDDKLDETFYAPATGGGLGEPLRDEVAMALDQPIELDGDGVITLFEERREKAAEALQRSRDLRAYNRFVEAHAVLEGPTGLHAALHALHAVLTARWADLHPAPPDERTARNARQRAFAPLRLPKLYARLEKTVLFDAGGFEREITLRHAWHAAGRHLAMRRRAPREADGETVYDVEQLQVLVARAEAQPRIAVLHRALTESAALLQAIETFLVAQPDYDRLRFAEPLAELEGFALALAPLAAALAPVAGAAQEEQGVVDPAVAATPAAGLANRDEARALLDAVLRYYARHARSSPVAMALLKIRQMEGASFEAWMTELEPEDAENVSLWFANVDASALDDVADAAEEEPAPPPSPPPAPAVDPAVLAPVEAALEALEAREEVAAAATEELAALRAALAAARASLETPPPAPDPPRPAAAAPRATEIRDRAQVRQALARLVAYYRAAEPSSPASLCFERLIELVDRSFLDILKRVAPKGYKFAALKLS